MGSQQYLESSAGCLHKSLGINNAADQIRWLQKDVRCWIDISWSNFLSLLQLYYNDVREHKTQVDNCGKDASWLIEEDKVSG